MANLFNPPANLDDLDPPGRQAWSEFVSTLFDQSVQGGTEGPRGQFYNPLKTPTAADQQSLDITWIAFPRSVTVGAPSERVRWQRGDATRDVQDEYCEWSVTRDAALDKITRITFTCEGPEYWQFLASRNRNKVLDLYRQFVSPEVQMEDLFPNGGEYETRNRFNNSTSQGAMHLVQRNNTLSAEIEIVAAATVTRNINGRLLMGEQELIDCGQYGAPTRNSDPHIGGEINKLAREKADVTLTDPIGLYIAGLSTAGWSTPDGSDPQAYWKIVRGTPDKAVRAVYEVPAGKGFVVGDISIGGNPIKFGSQVADFIQIKVTGLACRFGQSTVPPMTACFQQPPVTLAFPALHPLSHPTPLFKKNRR
jgi:hypothetical protein